MLPGGRRRAERRITATLIVLAVLVGACSVNETQSPSGSFVPSPSPTSSAATPSVAGGTPRATGSSAHAFTVATFPVPPGSHPHDVAPAAGGGVWYTAQAAGKLGWLGPASGAVREVELGKGSAPHGVIVGPDGAPWITDAGLNAIVRVDATSRQITTFPLPAGSPDVGLNTAAFDGNGTLWFTGQAGYVGRLDQTGGAQVFAAPRGLGPYGIAATPGGDIYFASLAGSYLGAVDRATGSVTVLDPPTPNSGPRRVWADSRGRLWVSEWNVGQVAVYDPADDSWREWKLPGDGPMAYAVFVDDRDIVWLTDVGANAIVRFDPVGEAFTSFPADSQPANVRQLLGRPGEVWGAESAADRLVVIRSAPGG
jgi:virginiamycin B lyase